MDIKNSPSGRIIKAGTGYSSFIPNPLPPHFEWTTDLINSLSRADYAIGTLSREGGKMSNPYIFAKPFIAREAALSSRIEGTRATISELLASEIQDPTSGNQSDIQEVQNYIDALHYGIKRLKDLPLSLRLIKELHVILMQGVRGSHATPGEFRRTQNWIGIPGCTLMTAKYVPPTTDELMPALGAFELFLHDRTLPPLIHAALCHYQFEAIHPFLDGNGRLGRLLIVLLLIERDLLSCPILYISAFFQATQTDYYRYLYNVSAFGHWHEWLMYFLNGIALQSTDALSRIERMFACIEKWQHLIQGDTTPLFISVIQQLASNPFVTAKSIAETYNVAFTTAQRAIQKLEALNIIKQTEKGKRDRLYCALDIVRILEEPAHI